LRCGALRRPDRFAGARLRAAVDPERPRDDGRVDVLRAGMRQTVIAQPARTGQADGRVPLS